MNAQECIKVVAFIAARCPAMRLEDATAGSWFEDLERFTFADCREAARVVSARQAFVGLHDLIAESERIERQRLGRRKVAELEAEREREDRAIEAGPPIDRDEVAARLKAMAASGRSAPRVDRRAPDTRRSEARAELDAIRVAAPTAQAGKDAGNG